MTTLHTVCVSGACGLLWVCILMMGCALPSVVTGADCPVGKFGPTCNGTCHCLNVDLCDSDTGLCSTGKCEKGYYKPPTCQEECPDGRYGMDCDEICHCLNDSICDKQSGFCPNNLCHPDWYSAACSKRLPKLVAFPTVSEATCTYLTVTWPVWNADTDFGDLELPVAEYRLYSRLNSSTTGGWRHEVTLRSDRNTSATHFSYNMTSVSPDRYYVFRVDAHGSNDGKVLQEVSRGAISKPPTLVPCTTTTVPPPVTIPVIVGTEIFSAMAVDTLGNTTLLVTWSVDPELRRFSWNITLSYQLVGTGDCSTLNNEEIITVPVSQSDTEYRLDQLQVWSRYEVSLEAQGTGVISSVNGSEVVTGITGEIKPSKQAKVSQLRATNVETTAVTLTWSEVPCAERGGALHHYYVIISTVFEVKQQLHSNATSVEVRGLEAFTEYLVMVRFVNNAGKGPYSEELAFTTAEGVPEAVEIRQLVPTTSTVVVHFDRPVANGRLQEFYVLYSTSPTFTSPTSLSVNASTPDDPVIRRLTPETEYYVKVRASTGAGYGQYGRALSVTTLPVQPLPPGSLVLTALTSSCASLSWVPPDQTSATLTGYKVTVTKDEDGTSQSVELPPSTTNYTHCQLDPGAAYTVSVVSVSQGGGAGEASTIQVLTEQEDPPTPPTPTLHRVTPTTATLLLRPVSVRPGPTIFYQVEVERVGAGNGTAVPSSRRRKRLAEVPGYVTAQLSQDAVQQSRSFVVGDGNDYGGYTNLALQPDTRYQVYFVLVSRWNGLTKFSLSQLASPFLTQLPTTTTTTTTTTSTNATTTVTEVAPPSPEDDNGGFIGVIIALVAVIILIVVVIILILWWRRRQRNARSAAYIELDEEQKVLPVEAYDPERYWNRVTSLRESRYIVVGRECLPDHELVPVGTEPPLPTSPTVTFLKEFQSLPHSMEGTGVEEAMQHPDRNRFHHILPYDHSLVLLAPDASSDCTYINANFLTGYRSQHAYIAAQSPYDDTTALDLWRLIHQYHIRTVVTLANVVEDNIVKYTQFWPLQGKVTIGQFLLELEEAQEYADFSVYDVSVRESGEEEGEEQVVRLFDFTAWPPHGVPDDPLPFLDLRHKVRQHHGDDTSPILVHCGTGVARSGVFIAVDSLIDQYAAEGRISVFSFVRKMRSERPLMVRTSKQYVFIYECLLEHFQAGQVLTDLSAMKDMYHNWITPNVKTGNSFLKDQFQLLQRLTRGLDSRQCSEALLPRNLPLSRYPFILPADRHRPPLFPMGDHFAGDYINAIYVNGYRQQNQFIVTQSPLHNTVADFWRLLYQQHVSAIVAMDNYNQQDGTSIPYWAPDVTNKQWGPFRVQVTSAFQQENVTIRDMELTNTLHPDEEPQAIRQFQFNGWAEKSFTPVSKTMALDLLDLVLEFQRTSPHPHSPIVVHCEDGATHSGLLVCLAVLCERFEEEKEVDVYHVIRHIKRRRPHILQDYDQYRFCYKTLWDFCNLRMPDGPFTEVLGQTKNDKVYGVASLSLTSQHDSLY
ncbi:LOW QUALITY PROTEIN: receptor-type tyrosine-protein phosphatase T-like [Babylonia areolata]|uniref:LOW QUALITY PROTEIN: receptor-type tyrosine-protein phosphatase T-like n=1 Tax=Babylonia areolata TaxID=304850 RepID=UPI003FD0D0E7